MQPHCQFLKAAMASSGSEFMIVQAVQQTAEVAAAPAPSAAQINKTAWRQQMFEHTAGQTKANYFSELRQEHNKLKQTVLDHLAYKVKHGSMNW